MNAAQSEVRLIVGTYSRLGGHGLTRLTASDDGLIVGASSPEIIDASFALWSRRHDRLYAVREQQQGRVAVIRRDGVAFACLDNVDSLGAAPCHLALDPTERLLAVANYESGSIAVFDIAADGSLVATAAAYRPLVGRGPDRDRQAGSHAHWVGFDGGARRLYCVDLGGDQILAFDVDPVSGALGAPAIAYRAPAGSGPRHLAFHPQRPIVFLVSELASTQTILTIASDGTFTAMQTLSTLPPGITGSLGGAIVSNAAGNRVYVTNRGHDSIAVFATDASGARLIQHVSSGGASPRFLLLLEAQGRLLVANEEGGTVCQFRIGDDGRLTRVGDAAHIPGAVFLASDAA